VLDRVPAGRRTLERRFRQTMGRSILSEIRRAHVERAKQLLSDTELSMSAIADASGFSNRSRFGVTFQQLAGIPPANTGGWRVRSPRRTYTLPSYLNVERVGFLFRV